MMKFEEFQNQILQSSVLITNSMLANYGVTPEQLHQDALKAAVINNPATFRSMSDVLHDLMGPEMLQLMSPIDLNSVPMYVASVEGGVNGASVIAYPHFMDAVANEIGGDFFILPSSLHEVLIIPDDGSVNLQELENMVREVNASEVMPQDQLSDNVYHYDEQDKIFELASSFEDRMAAQEQYVERTPEEEAFVKMGKAIMAVPIPDNVVKEMEKNREKPSKERAKPSRSQDVLS